MTDSTNSPRPADNGKTVAIVSYFSIIGWIIALVIHGGGKTRLGAYHLRQALGLMILSLAVGVLYFILGFLPMGFMLKAGLNIGLLILWVMGLISAISGEEKPVPIVGVMFQTWFAGLGL